MKDPPLLFYYECSLYCKSRQAVTHLKECIFLGIASRKWCIQSPYFLGFLSHASSWNVGTPAKPNIKLSRSKEEWSLVYAEEAIDGSLLLFSTACHAEHSSSFCCPSGWLAGRFWWQRALYWWSRYIFHRWSLQASKGNGQPSFQMLFFWMQSCLKTTTFF